MRRTVTKEAYRVIAKDVQASPLSLQQPRCLSTTSFRNAIAIPITAVGPPPEPPQPSGSGYGERIDKRRRQQEMLQRAKDLRAAADPNPKKSSSPLRRRFWKEVNVEHTPEGYQIMLDEKPVRTPSKQVITVPLTKPHLAHAIAIEWDLLESAQQALKNHKIPMTSLVSRAHDILEEDAKGVQTIREEIMVTMMRYLDTDTLLCWDDGSAGEGAEVLERQEAGDRKESLRNIQMRAATPIIAYLTTTVWPGVEIRPVLNEGSIMPVQQPEATRSIIGGWIAGLPAYELAGLERAVIATKSLLVGTRLMIAWSEEFRDLQRDQTEERFGIEQAAQAASLEVNWQTGMWGEVEDTHDVEKEDVRRQLGSTVLMVSGLR